MVDGRAPHRSVDDGEAARDCFVSPCSTSLPEIAHTADCGIFRHARVPIFIRRSELRLVTAQRDGREPATMRGRHGTPFRGCERYFPHFRDRNACADIERRSYVFWYPHCSNVAVGWPAAR